jgi:hypothetical protein
VSNKAIFGILLLLGIASASYNGNLTLNISHGSTLDFNTTGQVINGTWFMLFNFTPNTSLEYNFSYAIDGVWRVFPDTKTLFHPFGAIASGGGNTTINNITNNYTTSYNFTNDTTTNASTYLVLVNGTGNQTPFMSSYLKFNPLTQKLSVYKTDTQLPNSAESNGNQYLLFHSLQNGYSNLKTVNNVYVGALTGMLNAPYLSGLLQIVEDSATNQYFPVLYGNSVSSWSYLYGTPQMRYNPSLGQLSAPYFVGNGSMLTNLPAGNALKHVICKSHEWRDDGSYPPTHYDTGFQAQNIGYDEFYGATTSTQNQYVHFTLQIMNDFQTNDLAYFEVNFANVDAGVDTTQVAWLIEWSYAGDNEVFTQGSSTAIHAMSSADAAWTDHYTAEVIADASEKITYKAGGKFVIRMTRDINVGDTAVDTEVALLSVGLRYHPKT